MISFYEYKQQRSNKTVAEVFDTLNEEQKAAVEIILDQAIEDVIQQCLKQKRLRR